MYKKRILALILSLNSLCIFAQENLLNGGMDNGTNLNVLYTHDMSGKIYANTRGYGVSFHQGRHITANSRSFYEVDIQTLKHLKEIKTLGEAEDRKRYVYGKINSVLVLRGAIGMQKVLFAKADVKAVEVRYSYSIGPAFAFAKPYYVKVYKTTGIGKIVYNYARFDADNFSKDSGTVIGRAPYSYGLNELKIYPGINAKFNLSFEYAPFTNLIRAIETGVSVDYYPKALPIMARNSSENVILTMYVAFVFGTKWF